MKKFITIIIVLAFSFSFHFANSQNNNSSQIPDAADYPYWINMMQDPDANFYEVQEAFEKYWEKRPITKGCGWKPFKRWEAYWQFRVLPDGSRPAADQTYNELNKYIATHTQAKSPSGDWINLGPFHIPSNKGYEGLGRLNAIAFHPTDPDIIYVGAPAGGLWKTTVGGNDWTSTTDDLPTLGVSSILVDYVNPDIVLIGTGDRDAGDAVGMGIFKSVDAGMTWNISNTGMGNLTVGRLLQHPTDNNTAYAASNGGIFITTDLGDSWTTLITGNFKDIVFKPTDPQTMYATSNGNFYKSTDSGNSWVIISSGLPGGARGTIGVTPDNPEVVYFFLCSSSEFKGLYKSENSGNDFTEKSNSPNIMSWGCDGGSGGQAWYDQDIAVDPLNESILFVGGVNCFKSIDDGVTWEISSHWYGGCNVPSVHADLHVLEYNPVDGRLYAGNDGGIYWTNNGGTTWPEITDGMPISQVYRIGQSATVRNKVINGYQDNGTSTLVGNSWYTTGGGDGMECIIDHKDAAYSYSSVYYGSINRYYNNNYNAHVASEGSYGINEDGAWITPYILDENDENTMFIGYKNIWRCNNVKAPESSIQWKKISNDLGGSNSINMAVLEQSPVNTDILYAARSNGDLFRSDNAKDQIPVWIDLSNSLPTSGTPTDLEAHPDYPDIVYMTLSNRVFKSLDRGFNWEDISGTLPDVYLSTIVYYKNSQEGLYVGSDAGVFYMDASMTDWIWFRDGLPIDASINELEIFYDADSVATDVIRAGTYGRGLWSSDMYFGALTANFSASQTTIPPGCGIDFNDLSFGVPHEWSWHFEGATPATSSEMNPTGISYSQTGTYNVSLKVTNSTGSDSLMITQYITVDGTIYPEANFTASDSIPCIGESIQFEDQSGFCPDYWEWSFSPNTVNFLQGTNANSQDPLVEFIQSGFYTVTLYVENSNGSNTLSKVDYIMNGGFNLPFSEDFENGFGTRSWTVINPDYGITWGIHEVSGNSPGNHAAWVNFFDYYSLHPRDKLVSPPLDFSGMSNAYLQFEHAYAQRQTLVDSLIVFISDDCGDTWTRIYTGAPNGTGIFATSPPNDDFFVPQVQDDWCGHGWGASCNILDISQWAGSENIKVMFETVGRFGNNLYIDNILISSQVSINEATLDENLVSIYPNPSDGSFNITFNEDISDVSIEVYNSQGQIIDELQVVEITANSSKRINLDFMPEGIYIVKVSSKEVSIHKKIVIHR